MQIAVFTNPREIYIQKNTITLPKDDEVRFKGCGLRASDKPVWKSYECFSHLMPLKDSLRPSSLLNNLLGIPIQNGLRLDFLAGRNRLNPKAEINFRCNRVLVLIYNHQI